MTGLTVGPGTRVTLHFSLELEDGQVVDSTFDGKPAAFVFGDGNLPSGFESLLVGLVAGDERTWAVPPENAFGQPNPNNVQRFRRHQFGVDMVLEVGLMVSFADAQNTELAGVVSSIEGDEVEVDFNHPLAGRTLDFRVQILAVESHAN